MFDIKIGTMISAGNAKRVIPELNKLGFESYEIDFTWGANPSTIDFDAFADDILSVLDGRVISACGFYRNPIMEQEDRDNTAFLLENIKKLNCSVLGAFAGGSPRDENRMLQNTISDYVKAWKPLADIAGENGVKVGFEGCGDGWVWGSGNIAFCSAAWELMFGALDHPALGLEWEPCHAMEKLADPISQLRHWADKVVHLHGKDGTIAWDVIRDYGIGCGHEYVWNRTPGFGDNNWADIFTILLQAGFEGACDIEGYHDAVHYDDMEWTAQVTGLNYLKRCRGGLEYYAGPEGLGRGFQGVRKK